MASWKGIYSNVNVLEQQTKDPKVLDQRKWADSKENPEVETTHEPIDRAIRLNGKEVELLPADCSPDSKMVASLEQAHQENKQLQEAACNPFSMDWTIFQGSYYFFSYSPGTWDVANQSCTSMGFHLVMINSIEEKSSLTQVAAHDCPLQVH
ncbi:CD209 antigen-like protein A [Ahaetulla prasina]|uniref:CD209 antigen-like protein A n=1 Tax=Ahaetulla prasina TaxID=499056 RepID=UPI002648A015|nr:CD209 antigen-like protein A [Ahaetulla prasina]